MKKSLALTEKADKRLVEFAEKLEQEDLSPLKEASVGDIVLTILAGTLDIPLELLYKKVSEIEDVEAELASIIAATNGLVAFSHD